MKPMVLFDLDGTLADSAPDLVAAANYVREQQGLPSLPYETLRPYSTQGARGLLKAALSLEPDHPDYAATRVQFLKNYEDRGGQLTQLFDGISTLLDQIETAGLAWGIVTNKLEYLAFPLVKQLGLAERAAVVVGGDTTAHAKPHPAPLLHAAHSAQADPLRCIYIGDDQRDILAGKAAGMATVVAAYGYGTVNEPYATWQADGIADTAHNIWPIVQRWTNTLQA